jgi:hypothetical protein
MLIEGTALPLWAMEIDPEKEKEKFKAWSAGELACTGREACSLQGLVAGGTWAGRRLPMHPRSLLVQLGGECPLSAQCLARCLQCSGGAACRGQLCR